MTQPRALYLADVLEGASEIADAAAAELRRLHEELERCKQVCAATSEAWREDAEEWKAQRKPLTDEEIKPIVQRAMRYYGYHPEAYGLTSSAGFMELARAIERAHGIGEQE